MNLNQARTNRVLEKISHDDENLTTLELELENLNEDYTGKRYLINLIQAMKYNRVLKCLKVTGNKNIYDFFPELREMLGCNKTINSLLLSGPFIDANLFWLLVNEWSCSFKRLPYNPHPPMLESLELSNVTISTQGLKNLTAFLSENTKLKTLKLESAEIGNDEMWQLCSIFNTTHSLKRLLLKSNRFDALGIKYLYEKLQSNCSLQALDLSYNNLGDEGIEDIANALVYNKRLNNLNLAHVQLTDNGLNFLSYALGKNCILTSLNISGNPITLSAIAKLREALQYNFSITEIIIDPNITGALEEIKKIQDLLKRNLLLRDQLHQAIAVGNSQGVKSLIQQGASLYTLDNNNNTPLHAAVIHNQLPIASSFINIMLEASIPLDLANLAGQTPLQLAKDDIMRGIFPNINPLSTIQNSTESISMTLFDACSSGNIKEVQRCLLQKQNPNLRNQIGQTALHQLFLSQNINEETKLKIARLLFIAEADPNLKLFQSQKTVLHIAAEQGNRALVDLLMQSNADVNSIDSQGFTPLTYATMIEHPNHLAIIQTLKVHGADVNAVSKQESSGNAGGIPIIYFAAFSGATNNFIALIKMGADISKRTLNGASLFELANLDETKRNNIVKVLNAIGISEISAHDIERFSSAFAASVRSPGERVHASPHSDECQAKIREMRRELENTDKSGDWADRAQSSMDRQYYHKQIASMEEHGTEVNLDPVPLSKTHLEEINSLLEKIKSLTEIENNNLTPKVH